MRFVAEIRVSLAEASAPGRMNSLSVFFSEIRPAPDVQPLFQVACPNTGLVDLFVVSSEIISPRLIPSGEESTFSSPPPPPKENGSPRRRPRRLPGPSPSAGGPPRPRRSNLL